VSHQQLLEALILAQCASPETFEYQANLILEIAFRNGKAEALQEQLEQVSA